MNDQPRQHDRSSVEIYRGVRGDLSCRVVAVAEDDSDDALREAQARALRVEQQLHAELTHRFLVRQAGKLPDHILTYLAEHDSGRHSEMARAIGASPESEAFKSALRLLLGHGRIVKLGPGVYSLPSPGP